MPVSTIFAKILSAGRAQFNARTLEAKRHHPGFDNETFSAFLVNAIDPLVVRVDETDPSLTTSIAVTAYDTALRLCTQTRSSALSSQSLIHRTWVELFPRLAPQITNDPAAIIGALSNAALYLAGNQQLRGEQWLQLMLDLAPSASASEVLNLGKVLAWRSGATHFRTGALEAANQLSEKLALKAVGAAQNESWQSILMQFNADPWWAPAVKQYLSHQVGDFSGFNGSFLQPPQIKAQPAGFFIKSSDRYFWLNADVWGAVLHPATMEEFQLPATPIKARQPSFHGNRLSLRNRTVELEVPAEGLSVAHSETTVAVSSTYSHRIWLFPLQ
jgi:hypothetical protein